MRVLARSGHKATFGKGGEIIAEGRKLLQSRVTPRSKWKNPKSVAAPVIKTGRPLLRVVRKLSGLTGGVNGEGSSVSILSPLPLSLTVGAYGLLPLGCLARTGIPRTCLAYPLFQCKIRGVFPFDVLVVVAETKILARLRRVPYDNSVIKPDNM